MTPDQEVASLLHHATDSNTLGSVIAGTFDQLETATFQDQRIGAYKIVRRLGQRGQGAVFEAVRADGSFDQRLAILIIQRELDSATTRAQFRQERQILAGIEHPHIARLPDGGETSEGLAGRAQARHLPASRRRRLVRASQLHRPSQPQIRQHPGDTRRRAEAARNAPSPHFRR